MTGERVRLRAIEPEDADALWRWHNDPEAMRWLETSYPESLAQIRKRMQDMAPNSYERTRFAVETVADNRFIGIVCLRDARPETGRAEIDIYFGESRNEGYGSEALRLLCKFGFDDMRLHAIQLWVAADNEIARHVYRKIGFVEEGRSREAFRRDGKLYDMVLMSMLAREYYERYA
ncbi:GNAT family N-acetyltransferase [Actinokineospora enzanensis]|uniref:GNAT family N-acetyltransferase n=1 Tax=Actinokineospora enzanensis TaxID=155975 RepID=UPI00036F3139